MAGLCNLSGVVQPEKTVGVHMWVWGEEKPWIPFSCDGAAKKNGRKVGKRNTFQPSITSHLIPAHRVTCLEERSSLAPWGRLVLPKWVLKMPAMGKNPTIALSPQQDGSDALACTEVPGKSSLLPGAGGVMDTL